MEAYLATVVSGPNVLVDMLRPNRILMHAEALRGLGYRRRTLWYVEGEQDEG